MKRGLTLFLMVFSAAAAAQADYPNKPVRLVVGFAAGGISDVLARAIAIPASRQLGQ
jgi:tripartite-type tricarboxylate transporter receptor subunit TctC